MNAHSGRAAAGVDGAAPLAVWHLIHDLGPGGAEHVLVDLARVAPAAGLDLRVVSMMPLADHVYPQRIREAGVAVDSLELVSRWDPRGPSRLRRLVDREPPAVLHSHLKHADLLAGSVATRAAIPHVSTLHLVEDGVTGLGRMKRNLAARRRMETAAITIAVSAAVRDWYLEAFGEDPDRVVVVPNGIPAPGLVTDEQQHEIRHSFGIEPGQVLAAMVAVMRSGKGHDTLLEAAVRLRGMPIRFVLLGDGAERSRLEAEAAKLGLTDSVIFAGFREDVSDVLAASDLVVHPSLADALPTALIHGQAAGLPAVASDVGGIPEIVVPGTGLLVPPGDPAALAARVATMAGDRGARAEMGAAARRHYLDRFEGGVWASRLRDLYARVSPRSPIPARW